MDIGKKLKGLRVMKGLTQEELADRAELSKGFISQIERNLTSPSISTLMDILQCLGTDLKDFFSDSEDSQIVFKKTDYFEKFMSRNRLFTSTQVAKLYGISSAQKLNKMLHDNGIIYRQGTSWLPYANVNDKWYKQIINEYGTQLKFTSKGVLEIAKVINIYINEDELEQEIDK